MTPSALDDWPSVRDESEGRQEERFVKQKPSAAVGISQSGLRFAGEIGWHEPGKEERPPVQAESQQSGPPESSAYSVFAGQIKEEYRGRGLVAIDTEEEEVIAVGDSWSELDSELEEADYDPNAMLTLRCYE